MNQLVELRLHVEALKFAVDQNPTFFASIAHYVRRLEDLLNANAEQLSQAELKLLANRIEEFYSEWRPSNTPGVLYIPPRETSDTDPIVQQINSIVASVCNLEEEVFEELRMSLLPVQTVPEDKEPLQVTQPCVFIGHGRSKLWGHVKMYLEDELGLATVTYESESRTGESITPILEKMLDQSTFAVLVLTADDETPEGGKRARQNVVHEAGLFQGRLGFKKAVLLIQEGLESFSNIAGLQHIPFSGDHIEQAFYPLHRVLKREGQLPV